MHERQEDQNNIDNIEIPEEGLTLASIKAVAEVYFGISKTERTKTTTLIHLLNQIAEPDILKRDTTKPICLSQKDIQNILNINPQRFRRMFRSQQQLLDAQQILLLTLNPPQED